MSALDKKYVYTHPSGEDIYLFTLTNRNGTKVSATNYGAIITSFVIRDQNIVLGFDDVRKYFAADYLAGYPYFGCLVGRYANRIKNGQFAIDGKAYQVARNKGGDHLHGGEEGFGQKMWRVLAATTDPQPTLTLEYSSADGEEGYPGNLVTLFNITLTPNDELILTTTATTNQPTAVNLTHHDYFCLDNSGHIGHHLVQLDASTYLEQDDNFVTTGKKIPVAGTMHDFTQLRKVNANWIAADGFDQTFALDRPAGATPHHAATCISEKSQLRLDVLTTEPVVHFYTGKWIPEVDYKGKKLGGPFSGLCFETQKEPNAINVPSFSNTILRPGEVYNSTTIYRVSDYIQR